VAFDKGVKRSATIMAVAVSVAVAMTGCGSSSKSGTSASKGGGSKSAYPPIPSGPITFGVSLDLSGAGSAFGAPAETNWKNTLQIFNKANPSGIDGHEVKFDFQDDGSSATTGAIVARKMASNGDAAAVAASYIPASNTVEFATWEKAHLPMMTNNIATADYSDASKWPYFFSVSPSVHDFGVKIGTWLNKSGKKKIGVLTDGAPNSTENVAAMQATLSDGAKVVKAVTVSPGAVDVSTQISQLKAANPDAVVVEINTGFGSVWDAFKAANWYPVIVTGESAYFIGLTSLTAPLQPNSYTTCLDGLPKGTDLPANVKDGLALINPDHEPDQLTALQSNITSLEILKAAIEKEHSTAPDAIKAGVESLTNNSFFYDAWHFQFSPTKHAGRLGPDICHIKPTDSMGIPVVADPLS
jgi:ABC-type branched-subunit amino acid transport system substrate-binding protein